MHKLTRPIAFLSLLLVTAMPGYGQEKAKVEPTKHPFLWRIAGEPTSYLYGTVHVADPRVTEWPPSVQEALQASEVLLTEIDFAEKAGGDAMKASLLKGGKTLADVLPKDVFARLEAYLASKRYPIEGLQPMKPWVVMTMLPLLDDLKTVMSGQPLDMKLAKVGAKLGLATGALETLDEQLGVFEAFNAEEQAQMLNGTLALLETAAKTGRKMIQELIDIYLSGDLDRLESLLDEMTGLEDLPELKARLEQLILLDRNHRMVERLAIKLRAEPKKAHFVAVGALHYPGKDGLLALLRSEGFEITRVGEAPAAMKPAPSAEAKKEPVGAGK